MDSTLLDVVLSEDPCIIYSSQADEDGVAVGRPPQPVGTYGRIHFVGQPSGEVQARTRFRDYDGRVRMVTKVGRSRASAERALKAELSSRQAAPADARWLRRPG